jgi:hypothetical protein
MHNLIIELMQLGASLPQEKLLRIIEIAPLVDRLIDALMSEAVRQGADRRFTEAIVNLIVDGRTVCHLKSIPCIVTNPHASERPPLLALRENRHFAIQNYCDQSSELIAIGNSLAWCYVQLSLTICLSK